MYLFEYRSVRYRPKDANYDTYFEPKKVIISRRAPSTTHRETSS